MSEITIDPVTRVEGHLKVKVEIDGSGVVTDAKVTGNLFRDFENILKGRHPWDAVRLTQRICGVCPVPHALASTKAVERSLGFKPSKQALLLRALINGANFLQDHILHFYHLGILDYIDGPRMSPWTPTYCRDIRFTSSQSAELVKHYVAALEVRRQGHEMAAILAGRLPHVASIHPGGVTVSPTSAEITRFQGYLTKVKQFVDQVYLPDVEALAATYPDYFRVGRGPGNFLSFGAFDLPAGGFLLRPGSLHGETGRCTTVNPTRIAEDVSRSFYSSRSRLNPAAGETVPAIEKPGAYTWLKAPRYEGRVQEVGPLARLRVAGRYAGGSSVMDRVKARAQETALIADAMGTWLAQVVPGQRAFTEVEPKLDGSGYATEEAPRGGLAHWVQYSQGITSRYQIVTPTCWNASPRDDQGRQGALEHALVGTRIGDRARPIELLRIVHSFDPCLGCAVHVISPNGR